MIGQIPLWASSRCITPNATIQTYDLTVFDEIEALDLDYDEYIKATNIEI